MLGLTAGVATSSAALNAPIVAIAAPPSGHGYWLAGADGGVFAFGNARFYGSLGGRPLNRPVAGIAATPDGGGYWLVAEDGGVFAFGNARFHGSMGARRVNRSVVGIARTPSGGGYWLVAEDGGVFAFGNARFYGSLAGRRLNRPVAGIAATPDGGGYWLVAEDGGVFAFGNARFHGSMGARRVNRSVVGIARTPSGGGYWLGAADGGLFSFGDATFRGSLSQFFSPAPVGGSARGAVLVAPGANRPGVELQPLLLDYVARMAGAAGRRLVITTGTNHSKYTTSGSVSDHWTGYAADFGMRGNGGTNDGPVGDLIMSACLTTAGVDPATAAQRARSGGLFNVVSAGLRVQCIWRTDEGGNHHNHVHTGLRRLARSTTGSRSARAAKRSTPRSSRAAAARLRVCPDVVFRRRSSDRYYGIRAERISCRSARRVLRRYRRSGKRCLRRWRCTYGVEPRWTVEQRIRFTRGRRQIYFAVVG